MERAPQRGGCTLHVAAGGVPGAVGRVQCYLLPPLLLSRFTCDDVDFNLRVHSAGLLLCRFNRFSVMKKQIAVGGHRSCHITSKVSAPTESAAWAAVVRELAGRPGRGAALTAGGLRKGFELGAWGREARRRVSLPIAGSNQYPRYASRQCGRHQPSRERSSACTSSTGLCVHCPGFSAGPSSWGVGRHAPLWAPGPRLAR